MNKTMFLLLLCVVLLIQCGIAPQAGGATDTELGSTATGQVFATQENSAAIIQVNLFPETYNPVTDGRLPAQYSDTADAAGRYLFTNLPAGSYSIVALEATSGDMVFITGIELDSRDTGNVPPDTLRMAATLAIRFPDSVAGANGYVYLPGTSIYAPVNEQVLLCSVPPGSISVWYGDTNDTLKNHVVCTDITVLPGDTSFITDVNLWKHAATITLNTTASGAAISGDVHNIPVLVRLTGDQFPFSEVLPHGEDLLFLKPDGLPLPHEVELWNSADGVAAVWVKVDTVFGNNSRQLLKMYWGNSHTLNRSDGAAVFDTADGFTAVWHLGEKNGSVVDASGNHYNGTRAGNLLCVNGAIGYGQLFDGNGSYFEMENGGNPDTAGFTLTAWIKPAETDGYRAILSKSYGDTPSSTYGWLFELGDDGALATFAATADGEWGDTGSFVSGSNSYIQDTTTWHHVTAIFDRSNNNGCRLYIDGIYTPPFRGGGNITGVGPIINDVPLRIGADAKDGCNWKGIIDECTIARRIRSPEWVKLSFINQQPEDMLLTFTIDTIKP